MPVGSSLDRSVRSTQGEKPPSPHHTRLVLAPPDSTKFCADPSFHARRCCQSTGPHRRLCFVPPHNHASKHRPTFDPSRLQPSRNRPHRPGAEIGSCPLPFLVTLAARNAEQPRLRIDCLDDMRNLNRHQFRGTQPGIVTGREQCSIAQPRQILRVAFQQRPHIQPAWFVALDIPYWPLEPQRPRLLLRCAKPATDRLQPQLHQWRRCRILQIKQQVDLGNRRLVAAERSGFAPLLPCSARASR